jgi:hypothetical protein
MLLRKYIPIFLLIAAGFTANAQTDTTTTIYNLQKCLSIAIQNNLTVQQDAVTAERARIALAQAKDNMWRRRPRLYYWPYNQPAYKYLCKSIGYL